MTKRPPFVVILLVIVICFAMGLLNVVLREPESTSSLPTTLPPSPVITASQSVNSILIVGVDDLHSNNPRLRAVWIASFRSGEDEIYLHGIPLNASVPGEGQSSLGELFSWSTQTGLNIDFTEALYKIIPLRSNLTILMDESAFVTIIDYLEWVEIRGKNVDGESALALLSLFWDQPENLLRNQADILRSLIPKALNQPESAELTELFALIPGHADLSMDITAAVAIVFPLRETSPDAVFIILPDDISNSP